MLTDGEVVALAREVTEEFYDAVFDPAGWSRIARLIGSRAPELRPVLIVDAWSAAECRLLEFHNIDPAAMQAYLDGFVDDNPMRPSPAYARGRDIGLTTDFLPPEEFVRSRIYADVWRGAFDLRVSSANFLHYDDSNVAVLGFHYDYREQAHALPLGMQLHKLLAPHAKRSFQLALRAASLDRRRRSEDALSGLAIPAAVLDREGRVTRANDAAERLLSGGGPLVLGAGGRVRAVDPAADSAVEGAILTAIRVRRAASVRVDAGPGPHRVVTVAPLARRAENDRIIEAFVAGAEPAALLYVTTA